MEVHNPKIRRVAILLLIIEWITVLGIIGLYIRRTYFGNASGVSVTELRKDNLEFETNSEYTYFYQWRPRQTITHTRSWLPAPIIAVTNDDGLIGTRNYSVPKPSAVVRIIAVGDSFTEGPYVKEHETYPRQLEALLNDYRPCGPDTNYEVLNFGVGGYDIEYAAVRARSLGPKYEPDAVVWFMKDDDFIQRTETDRERKDRYFNTVQNEFGGDISRFPPYAEFRDELQSASDLKDIIHGIVVKEQDRDADQRENFFRQSSAVRSVTEAIPAPIFLVTYQNTKSLFRMRMRVWQEELGVRQSASIPALVSETETFLPHDGHPNERGYHRIARSIYDTLFIGQSICPRK